MSPIGNEPCVHTIKGFGPWAAAVRGLIEEGGPHYYYYYTILYYTILYYTMIQPRSRSNADAVASGTFESRGFKVRSSNSQEHGLTLNPTP